MPPIEISTNLTLDETDLEYSAIRAQGSGGQNVNKVATAIHLRFDIRGSSLPQAIKDRLLALRDQRITSDGCIIIKAQQYRSQEKNKEDAIRRLTEMIRRVAVVRTKRKPTRPSKASRAKRLDSKSKRGKTKALRKKVG